jgi:FlaA1/EpsC-like NDP-sugar epimerase
MIPTSLRANNGNRLWWTRLLTKQIQFVLDLIILVLAFTVSYALRFDFQIPHAALLLGLTQLPYVVLIQFIALFMCGVYSFIWRYVSISETRSFIKAALWSLLPILLLRLGLPEQFHGWRVPLSITIMDTIFAFTGVMMLRVARRFFYERYEKRRRASEMEQKEKKPVLLIGAGRAGVLAAREIQGRGDMAVEIRGFIDDDVRKRGSVICGIKVLGTVDELEKLTRKLEIDHVVITVAQASQKEIRRIVETCEKIPIKARIIPGLYEILGGNVEVSRIRDVQIEDLLGREPVYLEQHNLTHFLRDRTVMVTGAGGSIGSELARQVLRFQPSRLLLVERAEGALFGIDRELAGSPGDAAIIPLVADIGDFRRMRNIFEEYQPAVVFHAAAHKHVPMMENNPCEAVKNNILSTKLLGEMAGEFNAESFVMISTDKAVRPSSIMGASKRVAELIMQDLNGQFATRYVAVRFGNVIGSAGSVIPIFREQIRNGGPVTVTHPEMTRYFMTIPEAAQLVLQAGAMGEGGEILILDMGTPIRILDLAKDTITLSGLRPYEDIEIVFTGVRPGEKLAEALIMTEEHMSKTRHPKIFIGKVATYPHDKLNSGLQRLAALADEGADERLRVQLNELIPEATLISKKPETFQSSEPPTNGHEASRAAAGVMSAVVDPG